MTDGYTAVYSDSDLTEMAKDGIGIVGTTLIGFVSLIVLVGIGIWAWGKWKKR